MSLQDNSETSKISLTRKPESNAEVYVLGFFVGPYQILTTAQITPTGNLFYFHHKLCQLGTFSSPSTILYIDLLPW